eukprot:TRINITY_DN64309_c0_g1_i1.p1 TRINITY_DN64309_c0_g1~~TRINITY_DN64309_c0_g1_i1.p1  ORF type:complete len:214 (-),score=50.23 TRINITY_DN64309_c0_g1_i1:55-657(-)
MVLAECPICREAQPCVSEDSAQCGHCSTVLHKACLHAALSVDSRCPCCRQDFATVGYILDGVKTLADHQRPRNSNDTATEMLSLLPEIGDASDRLAKLARRANRLSNCQVLKKARMKTLDVLGCDTETFQSGLASLQQRCTDLPVDVAGVFRSHLVVVQSGLDELKRLVGTLKEKKGKQKPAKDKSKSTVQIVCKRACRR